MTHFLVGVVVPKNVWQKGDSAINAHIDKVMAPYAEEPDPKYLVFKVKYNKKDFAKSAKEILAKVGDDPELTKKYSDLIAAKDYTGVFDSWDGGELHQGNWGHWTNPDSFYDYYRVGGRWDGRVTNNPKESDNGFNWGDEHESVSNNSVPIKKLLGAYIARHKELEPMMKARDAVADMVEKDFSYAKPFREFFKDQDESVWGKLYEDVGKQIAKNIRSYDYGIFANPHMLLKVVSSDGVTEFDNVGWWGMSTPLKSATEYATEYLALLQKHKDDYIVTLDCHV